MASGVVPERVAPRREEVLERLTELYLAEGFAGFGIGELATRLRCSRTTLYAVAPSKEQIIRAAVRHYFRRAATRIEAQVLAEADAGERLGVYLGAVAEELAPASAAFYRDLADYPPAAEIYQDNTRSAARRVQDLVTDAVATRTMREVDAGFVGAAVAQVMTAIQAGVVGVETGLDDASAYRALADLVLHGLTRET